MTDAEGVIVDIGSLELLEHRRVGSVRSTQRGQLRSLLRGLEQVRITLPPEPVLESINDRRCAVVSPKRTPPLLPQALSPLFQGPSVLLPVADARARQP